MTGGDGAGVTREVGWQNVPGQRHSYGRVCVTQSVIRAPVSNIQYKSPESGKPKKIEKTSRIFRIFQQESYYNLYEQKNSFL